MKTHRFSILDSHSKIARINKSLRLNLSKAAVVVLKVCRFASETSNLPISRIKFSTDWFRRKLNRQFIILGFHLMFQCLRIHVSTNLNLQIQNKTPSVTNSYRLPVKILRQSFQRYQMRI